MRIWLIAAAGLLGLASPAWAQGPEQLEQLEPGKGEWQLEYFGVFGAGADEREHALQALTGVSDHVALGAELETRWADGSLTVESIAPTVLYRFSNADAHHVGVGLEVQAAVDRHAHVAGAEARLIVERRTPAWWLQADAIVRHARQDGEAATSLAYGWAVSRAVTGRLWLGIEGSGQAARLGGAADAGPVGEHFLGPSLTCELPHGTKGDAEIGIAWLRRVTSEGPTDSARVFVQLTF